MPAVEAVFLLISEKLMKTFTKRDTILLRGASVIEVFLNICLHFSKAGLVFFKIAVPFEKSKEARYIN